MVKIYVNEKEIEAKKGQSLLKACLDNDIYIPNLCYLDGMDEPPASCRLCFVELEGMNFPVTSCTLKVEEGMRVFTDTEKVRNLQKTALKLLLSVHDVDCKNCHANKKCDLQKLAKFLKVGLKVKELAHYVKENKLDTSSPYLDYYPSRCILCGKCIYVCKQKLGWSRISFVGRGFGTTLNFHTATDKENISPEICKACADICPVGALALKKG